jgi:hypothetical protein
VARVTGWNRVRGGFNNDAWTGSTSVPLKLGANAPIFDGPYLLKRTIVFADLTTFVVYVPDSIHNQGYGWWQDVDLGLLVWLRQEPIESPPDWVGGGNDPRILFSGMLHPNITSHAGVEDTLGDEYTVEWRLTNEPIQSHGERSIPFPLPGLQVEVSIYNSETNPEGVNWLDPALFSFNQSGRLHISCLWEGNG